MYVYAYAMQVIVGMHKRMYICNDMGACVIARGVCPDAHPNAEVQVQSNSNYDNV